MRPADATGGHSAPGEISGKNDVCFLPDWLPAGAQQPQVARIGVPTYQLEDVQVTGLVLRKPVLPQATEVIE